MAGLRKVTRGTGIFERQGFEASDPTLKQNFTDGARELIEGLSATGRWTFRNAVADVVAYAEARVHEFESLYVGDDGETDWTRARGEKADLDSYNDARLALKLAHWIDERIAAGDAENAVRWTMELCELLVTRSIAERSQQAVLAGNSLKEAGRRTVAARRSLAAGRDAKILAEYEARGRPKGSRVKERLAKAHGVSTKTVSRALQK